MRTIGILGFLLVSLSMFGLPAFAKTPDRQTPAKESVCDPLKDDGVTKGLYGLCVAFCEAQDHADELVPISREKLARLKSSSPSGRLLANYDKKRQAGDPEMPCIVVAQPIVPEPIVAQPCPCWSTEEASAIDGVLSDGSTALGWGAPSSDPKACGVDPRFPYIVETGTVDGLRENTFIQVVDLEEPLLHQCKYQQMLQGRFVINTLLSIENVTLTAKQLAACKADLLARQRALDLCQPNP
jgi:hypothetical protein